jgi:pyridoxamine 5'-phosphate oxidase
VLEDIIIKLTAAESLPDELPGDPLPILTRWYDEAKQAKATPNPDAIALATTTPDARPSVRMVLCRSVDSNGSLLFYTNYQSRKAGELESHNRAAICFHWDHQGRQARAEGFVVKATDAESDAYFNKRALLSRLGAWASQQSRPLQRRSDLVSAVAAAAGRMKVSMDALLSGSSAVVIPRPPHWGGFRFWIDRLELWCGGNGRLHDRAVWSRERTDGTNAVPVGGAPAMSAWSPQRLYP